MKRTAALVLLFLAGCGVLVVDVDVYKGPLVHHEEIQLGQTVIMAIAAQPLLVTLRDRIEWWDANSWGAYTQAAAEREYLKVITEVRAKPWYEASYLPIGSYRFRQDLAAHLNALLSLYEDRPKEEYAALMRELRGGMMAYRDVRGTLIPGAAELQVWKELKEGLYADAELGRHPLLGQLKAAGATLPVTDDFTKAWTALRDAYESYITQDQFAKGNQGGAPRTLAVVNAQQQLSTWCRALVQAAANKPPIEAVVAEWRIGLADALPVLPANKSQGFANQHFLAFRDGKLIESQAKLLFTEGHEGIRTRFVEQTRGVAAHFGAARDALVRCLTSALRLTMAMSFGAPSKAEDSRLNAIRTMASLVPDLVSSTQLTLGLKAVATEARPGRWLAVALAADLKKENVDFPEKSEAAPEKYFDGLHRKVESLGGDAREIFTANLRRILGERLVKDPWKTAGALMDLHEYLRDLPGTGGAKSQDDFRSYFGLVRGPTTTEEQFTSFFNTLKDLVGKLESAIGDSGFERGRLGEGLYTLLERYLDAQDTVHGAQRAATYKGQLLDALVRYAETVSFLANNLVLVQERSGLSSLTAEGQGSYRRLLEAVGSSILVQVDELRKHQDYKERAAGELGRERAALEYALQTEPTTALADIDRLLAAQEDLAKGGAAAARDAFPGAFAAWLEQTKIQSRYRQARTWLDSVRVDVLKEFPRASRVSRRAVFEQIRWLLPPAEDATAGEAAYASWEPVLKPLAGAVDAAQTTDTLLAMLKKIPGAPAEIPASIADTAALKGNEARDRVFTELEKLRAKAREKLRNADARGLIGRMPAPMDATFLAREGGPRTSVDLLGDLIRTMQYEKVETIRLEGAASPRAKQIEEALETAREYRSGVLYLQPPSAYLRSSTPSSSVQGRNGTAWENLLWRQLRRSIPFLEECVNGVKPGAELAGEIDKQFWQNINRVRVAGAGNVNYTVVKDDVGNWYVKGYSADPDVIFKSMKNLAAFAGGPIFAAAAAKAKEAAGAATAAVEATATAKAVEEDPAEKYRKAFEERCEKEVKDLQERALGLVTELKAAAQAAAVSAPNTFDDRIDAAFQKGWADKVKAALEAPEGRSTERLLKVLRSLKVQLADFVVKTGEVQPDGVRRSAQEAVARKVRAFIAEFARRREASLLEYETALRVLSE